VNVKCQTKVTASRSTARDVVTSSDFVLSVTHPKFRMPNETLIERRIEWMSAILVSRFLTDVYENNKLPLPIFMYNLLYVKVIKVSELIIIIFYQCSLPLLYCEEILTC